MSVQFTVEKTWDVKARAGLLVRGRTSGGSVWTGMKLRSGSGRTVSVQGIELIDVPGTVTIVVDRSATWLHAGMTLTDAAAMVS